MNSSGAGSSLRSRRHYNFIKEIDVNLCYEAMALPPLERCQYIIKHNECHEPGFVFDYMILHFCHVDTEVWWQNVLAITGTVTICIYLFITLLYVANNHLAPCLKIISALTHMNQNLAGVTILSFGSSAPDIFTDIAGIHKSSRIYYSDTYCSVMFTVFFLGGLVIYMAPFTMHGSILLRDFSFLVLNFIYVEFVITQCEAITIPLSVGILLIYVSFIVIVFVDQFLTYRVAKSLKQKWDESRLRPVELMRFRNIASIIKTERLRNTDQSKSKSLIYILRDFYEFSRRHNNDYSVFDQLWFSLKPINIKDFKNSGFFRRSYLILRLPVKFLCTLLIPIIDYQKPLDGWSKLLNCLQMMILPALVVVTAVKTYFSFFATMLLAMPIAVFVYTKTKVNAVPRRHSFMAILSIVGSMFFMYICATELVCILEVISFVTTCSNSFLGCTLLAWGNGIGDVATIIALTRHGYYKMAFAACIGASLFNSLVGMGFSLLFNCFQSDTLTFTTGIGALGDNSYIFLFIGSFCFLFGASITDFVLRRSIGLQMMIFYGIFVLYIILAECSIIHTYGTDHSMDLLRE